MSVEQFIYCFVLLVSNDLKLILRSQCKIGNKQTIINVLLTNTKEEMKAEVLKMSGLLHCELSVLQLEISYYCILCVCVCARCEAPAGTVR